MHIELSRREGGVAAAPVPARIVEKGLVGDGAVVNTVAAKHSDHLPLYRQGAILERELGIEISRATLDGWVMRVGARCGKVSERDRPWRTAGRSGSS